MGGRTDRETSRKDVYIATSYGTRLNQVIEELGVKQLDNGKHTVIQTDIILPSNVIPAGSLIGNTLFEHPHSRNISY